MEDSLLKIRREVIACTRCPRLVEYRERVAREKKRAYRDWEYWGRPVPGFGDPKARLLLIGLAPAAHGGNRTGRVFTGDRSGDFLFSALCRSGFANQSVSVSLQDGLRLQDAYVTASVRCAPPDNKPRPEEFQNCCEYLERELQVLKRITVVVALGRLAFNSYLQILKRRGSLPASGKLEFSHAAVHQFPKPLPALIASYHPSQQNTQTGKLTVEMFDQVFRKARAILSRSHGGATHSIHQP